MYFFSINLLGYKVLLLSQAILTKQENALDHIERLDQKLLKQFKTKFLIQPSLTRAIVSFQANKIRAIYRWYKYKEGFSASLVTSLLNDYKISSGIILDPFAGSGTALFAAAESNINADGIELLPIGQEIITARTLLQLKFMQDDFSTLERWQTELPWKQAEIQYTLPEIRITKGAYPIETKIAIEKYLTALEVENDRVKVVLRFALLCILESISYTRKDGQYLRWDHRSGRTLGKKVFDKGSILNFDSAIINKISEILFDLQTIGEQRALFSPESLKGIINLYSGSCLNLLPQLQDNKYDAIITSPPYCNRYDYTRTYALELALLGVGEQELISLRQQMLSCTVENRAKDLLELNPSWQSAIKATDKQELLQSILEYLEDLNGRKELNNTGIPRMVRGYFYEMACVISECSRVLKSNAPLFMINDNVRYAGASVSVDMILSDIAEKLGFYIENILVLPNGKGNSSQQMGEHGRESLRKCVYIWRKI
jgi:DNA modification methylase